MLSPFGEDEETRAKPHVKYTSAHVAVQWRMPRRSAMRRDDSSMHSSGSFLSLESLARLEPSLDQKSKSDYTGIFSDRDG